MKSEFKAKLIRHMLSKKDSDKGFTLIELLVVIIIIGILAAIALPSFLNQASKARQSEAKTYVGSMNRSQQAYYLEKQVFAPSLSTLSLGIPSTTTNYSYASVGSGTVGATGTTVNALNTAQPNPNNLKSYAGAVLLATPAGSTDATTLATMCEALFPGVNGGTTTPTLALAFNTLVTNAAPVCNTSNSTTGFTSIN